MSWEFNSKSPIFKQIIETLTFKIIKGDYKSGDKLNSVRDLAVEAGVNPNTMQRALSEIENTGLIVTQRGDGRYITEDSQLIEQYRKKYIEDNAAAFLEKMKELNISSKEISQIISNMNI